CQRSFEIHHSDLEFYHRVSPRIQGKTFEIPPPQLCPECRQRRRMLFRNERNFYSDECNLCGKKIISLYSPEKPFPVYCQDCFLGDGWDARTYGRDYNSALPFFDQFRTLQERVPRIALFSYNNENSEYTNHSSKNKNCYVGTGFGDCEDCM